MKLGKPSKKPTRTAAKRPTRSTRAKINYAQSSASSRSSSGHSSASSYETNGKKTPSPKANAVADRLGRLNIDDKDVESLINTVNQSKNPTEVVKTLKEFKRGDMYDKAEAILKSPIWKDKLDEDKLTKNEKVLLSELIHSTKTKAGDKTATMKFMDRFEHTPQFSKERAGELGLQRKFIKATQRTVFAATPGGRTGY